MARQVFFSFHYERDVWRANVVRNHWLTQDRTSAGFWDASLWEEAKRKGDAAIKKMINEAMVGASVTAVLIGAETASRTYVKYEIEKSVTERMGLIGVQIHQIGNQAGQPSPAGTNPLPAGYPLYAWFGDKGYENFGTWVETAAKAVGR